MDLHKCKFKTWFKAQVDVEGFHKDLIVVLKELLIYKEELIDQQNTIIQDLRNNK